MIQTHSQLKISSNEYNSLFSKNEFYPLQKAYTTPHFLVFSVRFPGKTVAIYIGRGNQYQGVYLHEKLPPSYLRVQDRLLDYLRKYLVGARLGKLEVDATRMQFFFHFKNEHPDNLFLFGYKERQLFFVRQSKEEAYLSWSGETVLDKSLTLLTEELGVDLAKLNLAGKDNLILDYLNEEEKKIKGKPLQKKKEKFLERKIGKISQDLEGVKNWNKLQEDLKEDRVDVSADELRAHGQIIKLHGLNSPWAKRDVIFKKIKKLKKAESILKLRLFDSENELENVRQGDFEFEVTKEKVIQPLWIAHFKNTKTNESEYNIKNFKLKNISGVLGLDALANDHIRAKGAKEHYWFHIESYPGAHCIVKTDDFSVLAYDDIRAVASMLRDFSKLELIEIPVIYSQLKNIKGVRGVRGEVLVKKPKYLRCLYLNWKEIISII